MDIKDAYLHGGVGVVKSIDEISDGQLKYTLASSNTNQIKIDIPTATANNSGFMSKEDKQKLDSWTDTTYSVFDGATTESDGTSGLVPLPLIADYNYFLKGDGTWAMPSSILYQTLPNNADLNDYTDPGNWYCVDSLNLANMQNSPVRTSFSLYVGKFYRAGLYQRLVALDLKVYYRRKVGSGSWSNWEEHGTKVLLNKLEKDENGEEKNINYRLLLSFDASDLSKTATTNKSTALYFNPNTGILTAPAFQGQITGNYVQLSEYPNSDSNTNSESIASTDTLTVALQKLEKKTDSANSWINSVTEEDTNDYIDKWDEIVGFLNSLNDDVLSKFVTTDTTLSITALKTFYRPIIMTPPLPTTENETRALGFLYGPYDSVSAGSGAYFKNGEYLYHYIGWGANYYQTQNCLAVSSTQLTYLNQNILHAGNYKDYTVTKAGEGATGNWHINITGNAATADNADMVGGKQASDFATADHKHCFLTTEGDNRNAATTPNDYKNNFIFRGIKYNTNLNIPVLNSITYSYLVGLRGWSDKTGGGAHELAFNDAGIFRRNSVTYSDEWSSWLKIIDSGNYTNFTVTKDGVGATGTWDISVTGTASSLNGIEIVSSKNISLDFGWVDASEILDLETGLYAILVNVAVANYGLVFASGVMSYSKDVADSTGDEIPLHVWGSSLLRPYIRTYGGKLQIVANVSLKLATITIKIAKIL